MQSSSRPATPLWPLGSCGSHDGVPTAAHPRGRAVVGVRLDASSLVQVCVCVPAGVGDVLAQRWASRGAFQSHADCLPPTGRALEGGGLGEAAGARGGRSRLCEVGKKRPWGRLGRGESRKRWKRGRGKGGISFSVVSCLPLRSRHGQERKEACPGRGNTTPHPAAARTCLWLGSRCPLYRWKAGLLRFGVRPPRTSCQGLPRRQCPLPCFGLGLASPPQPAWVSGNLCGNWKMHTSR